MKKIDIAKIVRSNTDVDISKVEQVRLVRRKIRLAARGRKALLPSTPFARGRLVLIDDGDAYTPLLVRTSGIKASGVTSR